MIAVDTTAIIAILRREPEAASFLHCMALHPACISAVSYQEASMVVAGRLGSDTAWHDLDELLEKFQVEIIPHDRALAELAREAFLRFGKGRHPARLNCGDCASYALAKSRRIPLLFKGTDFAHTDIRVAIASPPA